MVLKKIITTLLALYLIVGYIFAFYTWEAYAEDDSVEKDVVPKWMWVIIINGACLVWPYFVIKWFIFESK